MMNGYEYTDMDAILAGSFRAAIYCRLSKDDDLDGESASIANQRDMLEKYCEKQGWEVVAVYQDDGYTGLNMERPDLKRMLKAIERRQINLVITKDLSRLGRNYLQTGTLIDLLVIVHECLHLSGNKAEFLFLCTDYFLRHRIEKNQSYCSGLRLTSHIRDRSCKRSLISHTYKAGKIRSQHKFLTRGSLFLAGSGQPWFGRLFPDRLYGE